MKSRSLSYVISATPVSGTRMVISIRIWKVQVHGNTAFIINSVYQVDERGVGYVAASRILS